MMALDELLSQFADSEDDYERDGDTVQFSRHGCPWLLRVQVMPGVGDCLRDESDDGAPWVPAETFVQQRVLNLPLLANQIAKKLAKLPDVDKNYIESRGYVCTGQAQEETGAGEYLRRRLEEPRFGVTTLVLLMAPAGQGKTILLQHLALELARGYTPGPSPSPILLNVDLVGRYVGTIVDAIAGTLNKTIAFPLSHRDVMASIRLGWIGLSLDGFDELTARIGSRDAFLRITELVNELGGRGVVFLSARGSFFEHYRIRYAIRSYLAPRRGDYDASELSLAEWTEVEGIALFRRYGVPDPKAKLESILNKFGDSRDLVLQPFFLARLARLMKAGEDFQALSDDSDAHGRIKYALDAMITREFDEKWRTKEGAPVLSLDQHYVFLRAIAAEMWRSSAFQLDAEEIALVCEIAGDDAGLDSALTAQVKSRFPSHALMATAEGRSTFVHEKFFEFFLASFVAGVVSRRLARELTPILSAQEMSIDVADWVAWLVLRSGDEDSLVQLICAASALVSDEAASLNAGLLAARILPRLHVGVEVSDVAFAGECLRGAQLVGVKFNRCVFDQLDFGELDASSCEFHECTLRSVHFDHGARLEARMLSCKIASIEYGDSPIYDPTRIAAALVDLGATILDGETSEPYRVVGEEKLGLMTRICKIADRSSEFSLEDVQERVGARGKKMAKLAIRVGVLSQPRMKSVSGKRREFVRFVVDRNELLRGSAHQTADPAIEAFWEKV